MAGCVKEIGHREVYDILQSRKLRAAYGSYGESGFCQVLGQVRRSTIQVLSAAGRVVTAVIWSCRRLWVRCWSGFDMVPSRGGASGIDTESRATA